MAELDTDGRQLPPLIEPVSEPTDEQAELLDKTHRGDGPKNIFKTMVHNLRLAKRVNLLGGYFVASGLLPDRDRELVVLRTAYRAGADFEFGWHTIITQEKGLVTEDEIARLASDGIDPAFSSEEAQLLRFVDEISANDRASSELSEKLLERYSVEEFTELTLLVGFYRMLAGYLNTVRVNREDGVPGLPA